MRRKLGRGHRPHRAWHRLPAWRAVTPDSDLGVVRRAGGSPPCRPPRIGGGAAGGWGGGLYFVDVRVQEQQIRSQLLSVAQTADDTTDPPPGMILVDARHGWTGRGQRRRSPTTELLARRPGSRTLGSTTLASGVVVDRPQGRVAASARPWLRTKLAESSPLSLGIAELAGILASVAVVVFAHQTVDPFLSRTR